MALYWLDSRSVIQTHDATAISAVSARLCANLDLTDMRYANNSFGFYWGTNTESLYNKVTANVGESAITADLSALKPDTQYFFQS